MIKFTPGEFNQVREAIAGAHLLNQAIVPVLKQRHVTLDKQQRQLLKLAPPAVAAAYNTIATITQRESGAREGSGFNIETRFGDIDTAMVREELENVSALTLPDVVYEMAVALVELPMYMNELENSKDTPTTAAILMAWAWESGRRYGVGQALALVEQGTTEFKTGLEAVLVATLNAALDLPAPELPFAPTSERPEGASPSTSDTADDARSTEETDDDGGAMPRPKLIN